MVVEEVVEVHMVLVAKVDMLEVGAMVVVEMDRKELKTEELVVLIQVEVEALQEVPIIMTDPGEVGL